MKNLKRILSFFIVMGFMFVMFGFRVGVKATDQTWDLTTNSYSSATTSTVTWTSPCVTMTLTKTGSSTNANNYLGGGGNAHTRVYKDQTLTFTCVSNYEINSITLTAPSNDYATTAKNGAWTNATASADETIVTATPTDGEASVSVKFGAATRFTSIKVTYTSLSQEQIVLIASSKENLMVGDSALQLTTTTENIDSISSDVWASSNTSAATVSNTGLVAPIALGSTNITRTVNGTVSNVITLKIWPSNASIISIATAIEIAEFAGSSSESAFTYSTFGTITSSSSSTFVISDGAQTITVYKKSHGLSVGTSLVVTGNLTNYSGNTPEFTNPSFGYNVTFDTNGGNESYDSLTNLASGVKISDPGSPTRDGYNFVGWYNGENKWNFDTNTVTTSITLVARWASTAAQTAINNALASTKAYMSLAYTYTASAINAPSVYTKATSVSQLSAGDSVIIVSKLSDGTYYAMTNSLSNNTLAKSEAITIEDGVITSDISNDFVWMLYGNAASGWDLKNGDSFINPANGTNIGFANSENHKLTFVASGNNSYFLNNATRTMFYANSNSGFRNFAISNIGKTEYAAEVYVFVKQATAKNTYNDVDFRIRCAIDAGLGDLNEDYAVTFGIEVTAGGKTVRYTNSDGAAFQTSGGKQFVTLDLGDMLNINYANLDTEFTVKAYVEYDGGIFYSKNIKTFSVKGMVNQYYNVEHIDAVEGLKEILENYGYTFE